MDTTKTFTKDIPTNKNGDVDLFYLFLKAREKQLGLQILENGFDDLQIRVWYHFSLFWQGKLVVITNKDTNWTATVYNYRNRETETVILKHAKQVVPKSTWDKFSKQLLSYNVLTLPNDFDIPDCNLDCVGNDGTSYLVEVATNDQYRFYHYREPQYIQGRFYQAKNMVDILKLFEEELGVTYRYC